MHGEQLGWEYVQVDQSNASLAELNALGAKGWELVSGGDTLIFKRPAPGFRERVTIDQKRAVYERFGLTWPPADSAGDGA